MRIPTEAASASPCETPVSRPRALRSLIRRAAAWAAVVLAAACTGDNPVGHGGPDATATQQIVSGTQHVCTIATSQEVFCWGKGEYGAVAQPQSTLEICRDGAPAVPENRCSRVPRRVGGDTLRARSLAAGEQSTCAITTRGGAACWGSDPYALFGAPPGSVCGNSQCDFAPVALPFPQRWKQLSISRTFPATYMCGVTEAGEGFCWGQSGKGVLGNRRAASAPATFYPTPQPVAGGLRFVEISAAGTHTCGLTGDGVAYCWGSNLNGVLGTLDAADTCSEYSGGRQVVLIQYKCTGTPVPVRGGHRFADIATSDVLTCGVTTAGEVLCWGRVESLDGKAGGPPLEESVVPRAVLSGVRARRVEVPHHAYSSQFICALGTDDAVYCRGLNNRGQLGNGTVDVYRGGPDPTRVSGTAKYTQAALTSAAACAVTSSGGVNCWGDNRDQTLARPGVPFDPTPAPVHAPLR